MNNDLVKSITTILKLSTPDNLKKLKLIAERIENEKDQTVNDFIEAQEKLFKTYTDEIDQLKAENSKMYSAIRQVTEFIGKRNWENGYVKDAEILFLMKTLLSAANPNLLLCIPGCAKNNKCVGCFRKVFFDYELVPISVAFASPGVTGI